MGVELEVAAVALIDLHLGRLRHIVGQSAGQRACAREQIERIDGGEIKHDMHFAEVDGIVVVGTDLGAHGFHVLLAEREVQTGDVGLIVTAERAVSVTQADEGNEMHLRILVAEIVAHFDRGAVTAAGRLAAGGERRERGRTGNIADVLTAVADGALGEGRAGFPLGVGGAGLAGELEGAFA